MKKSRRGEREADGVGQNLARRRKKQAQSDKFRVGYTIAGESRQKRQAELERTRAHKKKQRRNRIAVAIASLLLVALVAAITTVSIHVAQQREEERQAEIEEALTPTVPIIDENASKSVSTRVTEFVAQLEQAAASYGLTVERVVLPFQKAREVHVYLMNHAEYYKMTIDRGSAVQAEDMSHMVNYLVEHEINCEYVDLRVKGRAYYK